MSLRGFAGRIRYAAPLRGFSYRLIKAQEPFWRHCLQFFALALVPSVVFSLAAWGVVHALGVDISRLEPPKTGTTGADFFGTVIFSPVIETFVLAALLNLLLRCRLRQITMAAISGVVWGLLHALMGPLWFFGTAWSFFIFSCAYLGWREQGFRRAYLAAAIPHALVNLSAMLAAVAGQHFAS